MSTVSSLEVSTDSESYPKWSDKGVWYRTTYEGDEYIIARFNDIYSIIEVYPGTNKIKRITQDIVPLSELNEALTRLPEYLMESVL